MITGWIAFLGYAAVAVLIGLRAQRDRTGEASAAEYWTAGRDLGSASVGLSISAGFLSVSWSCVYAVQLFYWYGIGAVWLITVPWLLALGGIYLLASRYHALPAFSQPEMVARRFGDAPRRTVAGALAFVFLVWGGAEIYVAATLLAPQLSISVSATILLISVVVAIYSTVGGFRAVIDTDKLQYGIVALYLTAMTGLAVTGVGAATTAAGTSVVGFLPAASMRAAKAGSWADLLTPGWTIIILTLVAYLPGWLFETDLWLRVQAARDRVAARRGVAIAAANALVFIGLLPLVIGVAALILYPPVDGAIPPEVGAEGERIFAALVSDFAPVWLAGLLALGLVAAAMSTIDTCTNVMALSIAYDLIGVSDRREGVSRVVTATCVAAACAFALWTSSLWDIFYLSSGVLTTAVAFPVAAVMVPGIRARAVQSSSVAGLAVTAVAYLLETRGPLATMEPTWLAASGLGYILWGVMAAAVGAVGGQILSRPGDR